MPFKDKLNSGKPEMIRATQFSIMGGPVGDPWISAYPHHCETGCLLHQTHNTKK